MEGKRILLHFGAVDYRCHVWVNGQPAGEHEGGNMPFCSISPASGSPDNVRDRRGRNFLPRTGIFPRGKQYWEPKSKSIFYTRTTGIWQTVWMEPAGQSYLDRVRITPRLVGGSSGSRAANVIPRRGPDVSWRASAERQRGGEPEVRSRWRAQARHAGACPIASAMWSPATPDLYDVTFELRARRRSDRPRQIVLRLPHGCGTADGRVVPERRGQFT